jgi:hypothetical protein
MQALLLHFRQHGKKAIEKVAREQPASYLKILGLLVPREHKVEHSNPLKGLTDEQLSHDRVHRDLACSAGWRAGKNDRGDDRAYIRRGTARSTARVSQTQEQSDAGGRHGSRPEGAHSAQDATASGRVISTIWRVPCSNGRIILRRHRQFLQKSLNRSGAISVYLTVCWMFLWPR